MKHAFLIIFCTFCTASRMEMEPKRKTYFVEIKANKNKENHSLGTVPTGQAENNGNGWMNPFTMTINLPNNGEKVQLIFDNIWAYRAVGLCTVCKFGIC